MSSFWMDGVPGRRRIDPDYCRQKAAFCRELATKPAHKTQAKILLKMAARFERQANGLDD